MEHYLGKDIPRILVGGRFEMRPVLEQPSLYWSSILPGHAMEVAQRIGAPYLECSAQTGTGVDELLGLAITLIVSSGKRHKETCIIA
jgi:hypothetical protein